jgi:hypothetical protein
MNGSKQAGMAIKTIVVLLVSLTLASVRLAEAQPPKKVPRIGFLALSPPSALSGPFFSRSRLASKTRSLEALKMRPLQINSLLADFSSGWMAALTTQRKRLIIGKPKGELSAASLADTKGYILFSACHDQ